MKIKGVFAKKIRDSREEQTIKVVIKTSKGKFVTSAPSGKSVGKYEVKPYARNLEGDIKFINGLDIDKINKIINKYKPGRQKRNILSPRLFRTVNEPWKVNNAFFVLKNIEKSVKDRIGGDSLFALEASLLKAIAKESGKELWEFLLDIGKVKMPMSVGNVIGGGVHSRGLKGEKPDFQEFLFIADCKTFEECVRVNEIAYKLAGRLLKSWRKNDEGAWETGKSNEEISMIMDKVRSLMKEKGYKIDIGLDVAASTFFKNKKYNYKNPVQKLNKNKQVNYIKELIKRYKVFYIEDALEENDFSGFKELLEKVKDRCLIVGDDLTATNPKRLEKAIKMKSINAVIVKPNQIGSLLKVKEVIDIAKKHNIKTVISHRSGETKDDTIADLAVGFNCDFIKTGIYGKVRKVKLKKLIRIEVKIKG